MSALGWTALFSLLAAAATLVGGLIVVLPRELSRERLSHIIAFGAGFMLATCFVSMLPASFRLADSAPFWILGGYALAHLSEHTFTPHFHFGEETHTEHHIDPGVSRSALVGLTLHALFDGVSISAGFMVSTPLGLFIALAVVLHKIPEGLTMASVTTAAGKSRRYALSATGLIALSTVVGALLMTRLDDIKGIALAVSCGITIYVAATDLIPELNQQRERGYSVSALIGVLLYFALNWVLSALGMH